MPRDLCIPRIRRRRGPIESPGVSRARNAPNRRPKTSRPSRETFDEKRRRAAAVLRRLARAYPDARCSLNFSSPLELLVATVLSAQCTDVRVNMVTPELFRKYRTAADYARAPAGELENDIRQTGFFNAKARSLRRAGATIAAEHGGRVPQTMEALVALPGVGRKTANVILGNAFGRDEGFVVDTHVARVTRRLGFTRQTDPVKIENDLNLLVPKGRRTLAAHQLIFHGRQVCVARRPRCEICPVNPLCPKIGVPLEIRSASLVSRVPSPRSPR
jgi:endonuclease-3